MNNQLASVQKYIATCLGIMLLDFTYILLNTIAKSKLLTNLIILHGKLGMPLGPISAVKGTECAHVGHKQHFVTAMRRTTGEIINCMWCTTLNHVLPSNPLSIPSHT